MTGFGKAERSSGGDNISVEIKSVNNRFCDVVVKLPPELRDQEMIIRERVQQRLKRGKITVMVRLDKVQHESRVPDFDPTAVKAYADMLRRVGNAAGLADETVTLEHLLNFGELFAGNEQDEEKLATLHKNLLEATHEALDGLEAMRNREGAHLSKDMVQRLAEFSANLEKIKVLSADRIPAIKEKMLDRIAQLVGDEKFDQERLELEVAIMADKTDITEEMVRLDSHIKFFGEAVEKEKSAGRQLNFLIQELYREVNTISSKANESAISHLAVEMKETLEQIREQVQNIA